jgi:hypothetical protein
MTFIDHLNKLSTSEIADLDDRYFIDLIRLAPIDKIGIYASMNSMTLVHCAIVIYCRPEIYPEFISIGNVNLEIVLKTMPRLSVNICGRLMPIFGLRDPKFKTAESYVNYIKDLLIQDPVYDKISHNGTVSISDVSDSTAQKCLESDYLLESLVSSIEEHYN